MGKSPKRSTETNDESAEEIHYQKNGNAGPVDVGQKVHPVDSANWFSFLTFSWISPLMFSSYRHGLDQSRIPFISSLESSEINTNRLEDLWNAQLKSGDKTRFGLIMWNYVRNRVILTSIIYITSVLIGFLSPTVCMRQLLKFSSNPNASIYDGVFWVALLILLEFVRVALFTLTWALGYRTSIRLRTAAMGLVYRKLLRLGNITDSTASMITNIIANDCNRIYEVILSTQLAIGGPFVLLLSAVYIVYELGYLALLGLIVFPLFYPIQYYLARQSGSFRRTAVQIQDKRVTFVSQALHYLKFLKMFAWEKYFRNIISDIRLLEKKFIQRAQFFLSMSVVIAPTLPHIAAIITFILYINSGNDLYPAQAFCVVALFSGRIRPSLNKLRSGLRSYFDCQIAIERLQCFTLLFIFSLFGYSVRSINQLFDFSNVFRLFVERIENILAIPEIRKGMHEKDYVVQEDMEYVISMEGVTIVRRAPPDSHMNQWKLTKDEKLIMKKQRKNKEKEKLIKLKEMDVTAFQLENLSLTVKKGNFVGICGQVGSGKSTFLQAISGALSVNRGDLHVRGRIAYAAQEPWIFKGTLRENVIFGEPFDAVRYYSAINACCLVNDFGILPMGDLTETSENGSNLSGGQKSRLSLARALYFAGSRDVFLLDDPFAALDNRVSKTVYERVVLNQLRRDRMKTVILVTHQMQYLKDCDEILVFSEGKIAEHGTHQELVSQNAAVYNGLLAATSHEDSSVEVMLEDSELLECSITDVDVDTDSNEVSLHKTLTKKSKNVQSMTGEGKISWSVYNIYINCAGGPLAAFFVLLAFALSIGSTAFSSWWLKNWFKRSRGSDQEMTWQNGTSNSTDILPEVINKDTPGFAFNRDIYAGIILIIFLTSVLRTVLFVLTCIRASQGLHCQMLTYFFRNRLKSSEKIGTGQILTLFSKDMEQIDMSLPNTLEFFLQNIFIVLSVFVLVTIVFPIFLVPLFLLFVIFIFIQRVYNVAIRDLKRLESDAKAPIFTKVNETVDGIGTIRAFQKEKEMLTRFNGLSDEYHSIFYAFNAAVRWLSFRLDCLAVSVTGVTAILILIFHGRVDGSSSGLALSYAAQLSGIFQFTVRLATETQARFVSVERIRNFIKRSQPEEPELFEFNRKGRLCKNKEMEKLLTLHSLTDVHPNWPVAGHVKFDSVYMSYSLEHETVLKDLSFEASPGQKIGIIGRTGSGKSSIGSALFRLTELKSGRITIDGVDISELPLSKLRNSLCVIPQDPAVFQQSIRFNLDPSKSFTDAELWTVLEKTGLKSVIESLDAEVGLSQGQRQLLSITRALLRRSTVLFVDEATSAIDNETSSVMDGLLAEEFTHSTVFIIAHRLKSLTYCDHLLIMDSGRLRDFGPVGVITKKPEFLAHFEKFEALPVRRGSSAEA